MKLSTYQMSVNIEHTDFVYQLGTLKKYILIYNLVPRFHNVIK